MSTKSRYIKYCTNDTSRTARRFGDDDAMKSINEMEKTLKNNRFSLNEAFNLPDYGYGDESNMDEGSQDDFPTQREQPNQPQEGDAQVDGGDIEGILKQIRILSLKGITQLAENPEDPNYDILKKIWVIVDKNTVEKAKEAEGQQVR